MWFQGRPASGYHDLLCTAAGCLPDFLARIGGRRIGYRSCVDYHQIGLSRRGEHRVTRGAKLARVAFNFTLIQTASNGIQVNLHADYRLVISGLELLKILKMDIRTGDCKRTGH